jgi:hypothetical protein
VPAGGGAAVALGLDVQQHERDRQRVTQLDPRQVSRGGADEQRIAGGQRALEAGVGGSVRGQGERMFA